MTSQKKQHYVPRFYLKHFSTTNGKSINIFNLRTKKNILNGNLKNQCYEDYFYGDDAKIENVLASVEDIAAPVVAEIVNKHILPAEQSAEHLALMLFIATQQQRTKYAADVTDDMIDKFTKNILQHHPEFSKYNMDEIRIGMKDVAAYNVPMSGPLALTIMDLKMHLIINSTSVNFITSDNPVFLYNQYCEGVRGMSSRGFASQGLQIFLPLSPKVLVLLYDPKIYKVGARADSITELKDKRDVETLNKMQWLGALENVYYSDDTEASLIEATGRRIRDINNRTQTNLKEYDQGFYPDGKQHVFIMMHKPDRNMHLNLSFMSIQRNKRKIPLADRINKMRDLGFVLQMEELVFSAMKHNNKFSITKRNSKH